MVTKLYFMWSAIHSLRTVGFCLWHQCPDYFYKHQTTQHLQFSPEELASSALRASLHTSLPCPSHLHPSVRLHDTGLWKERTEVLTESHCLSSLRLSEHGAYWFVHYDLLDVSITPSPASARLHSFLPVLSPTETWELKPLPYAQTFIYNNCNCTGKEPAVPSLPLQPPLWKQPQPQSRQPAPDAARGTPGMGNPTKALISAQEPAFPM